MTNGDKRERSIIYLFENRLWIYLNERPRSLVGVDSILGSQGFREFWLLFVSNIWSQFLHVCYPIFIDIQSISHLPLSIPHQAHTTAKAIPINNRRRIKDLKDIEPYSFVLQITPKAPIVIIISKKRTAQILNAIEVYLIFLFVLKGEYTINDLILALFAIKLERYDR